MSDAHQTLDIELVRRDLHVFHDDVARRWGRIEITRNGEPRGTCVLLSRAELDCLERALEILQESPAGQTLHHELVNLVAQVSGVNATVAGANASAKDAALRGRGDSRDI